MPDFMKSLLLSAPYGAAHDFFFSSHISHAGGSAVATAAQSNVFSPPLRIEESSWAILSTLDPASGCSSFDCGQHHSCSVQVYQLFLFFNHMRKQTV